MRPLHAVLVFLALALVGLGAWWLVGSGESPRLETAPPVAASPAPGPRVAADLVAPGVEEGGPARADRAVAEAPAPPSGAAAALDEWDAGGPTLRGRVVDRDGRPLAGARVLAARASDVLDLPLDAEALEHFRWARRRDAETGPDGRFELAGVPAGGLALGVRAPGHAPLDRRDLAMPSSGALDLGDLELAPGAVLLGRVVDATGAPVGDARVYRLDPGRPGRTLLFSGGSRTGVEVARTTADGAFRVDELKPGPWRVAVASEAHPDAVVSGSAGPGRAPEHVEVVLEPGYEIHGRVLDLPADARELVVRARPVRGGEESDGTVVRASEGAAEAESRSAPVGAGGRFAVRGLRRGQSYQLAALEESGIEQRRSDTVDARPGDRGVELRYQLESALVFQVLDARTREPVTELDVRAGLRFVMPQTDERGRRVREHPEGRVRFGDLRPRGGNDRAELQIEAVGYEPWTRSDIAVPVAQEVDLGTILLQPVPLLEVLVVDARDGAPVEGARVELEQQVAAEAGAFGRVRVEIEEEDGEVRTRSESVRGARTGADGVARVSSFRGETCVLRVRHRDFADHESAPFHLGADPVRRTVELLQGGEVRVRLLDAAGEPLAGRRIDHRAPGEARPALAALRGVGGHVTGGRGEVVFDHLAEGTHLFRLAEDSGGPTFVGGGGAGMGVVVRGPGAAPADDAWTAVAVAEGGEHELELVAPDELEVYGRVREAGEPLAGARLELRARDASPRHRMHAMMGGGGKRAETDGDGFYSIPGVRPGAYELVVTHPDRRMPTELDLDVAADERFDVELSVAVLEGRVTDEQGQPVAGARAWAERSAGDAGARPRTVMRSVFVTADGGGGGSVTVDDDPFAQRDGVHTDAEGRYHLRGVQADVPLVVRVEHDAAQPARSDEVTVADGQVRGGVDVRLQPAGEVVIRLREPDGSPARNLLLVARYEGEAEGVDSRTEFVGDPGWARLSGLKPGPWRLELRRLSFGSGADGEEELPDQLVEVAEGENEPVTIALP